MSIVPHNRRTPFATGSALINAASDLNNVVDAATSLSTLVRNIRRNLPDTRLDRGNAQSNFERKIMVGKNARKPNRATGNATARAAVEDKSYTGSSGGMGQRSSTGSRQVSVRQKSKVYRSIYTDKVNICFRAETALSNTALNTSGINYQLGIDCSVPQLATFMGQLTAMAGLFREYRFHRIDIDFVPQVGSTVNGFVAIGIDRDVRVAAPAPTGGVVRRTPFFEVDVKQPGNLTWTPVDAEDKRFRYTYGGSRPLEFLSHGVLLVASINDLANAATYGRIFVDAWVEFQIPY